MGSLTPGQAYIYERANGVVYARPYGGRAEDRFPVGWDADTNDHLNTIKEDKLWNDIRNEAKSNKVLQDALDRVKIIYELSKKDGKE